MKDNPDAPLWTTTCPWVIRLGLFQGNYSSLFLQEFFHDKKVMVASFHSFTIISARFQVIEMMALWERFKQKMRFQQQMEELNILPKPVGRERIDFFGWLRAHVWLQELSFGDREISQTNPSVFSQIH